MPTDYYAILGVSSSASPDAIKKRYRELARKYHPDVNPGAEAASKIKQINEAYHVLGDADRRATYDAERFLQQQAPKSARSGSSPASKPATPTNPPRDNRPTNSTARAQSRPPGGYGFDGFGRVPSQEHPVTPPRTPKVDYQVHPTPALSQLLAEAQLAYINRKYDLAERMAHKVLELDRRNATAHEILGDVYVKRGERIQANTAYAFAIQFNPQNQSVMAKLDRLAGGRIGHRYTAGPTVTRPTPPPPLKQRYFEGPNRERSLTLVGLASAALLAGELLMINTYPGDAVVAGLSWNAMAALGISGTLAGILLAFYGGMRPMAQALAPRSSASTPVGLNVLLSLFALVWFYASFIIYLVIGTVQNRTSHSVLRAYAVTFLLTLVFAWLYHPLGNAPASPWMTALFGGNILFPTVLLGWKIGDALRLGKTQG